MIEIVTSLKWLNSNQRLHRMAEADLIRSWRQLGRLAARGREPIPTPVRVVATIWKPIANIYDPGNLYPTAKACLDGFTDSGLWPDDNHRHVIGPDMRHGGKGIQRIVFTFEPVAPSD